MRALQKIGVQLILLAFAGLGLGNAQALNTSRFCNNWLIAGVYGFTIEGTKLAGSPAGPQVGVAMTEFDGQGNLSQIDAVTINGVQVSDFTHPLATGIYSVNADCTGTFTINFTDGRPPVTTYFVIVDNGNEIDTVVQGVPKAIPPAAQIPGVIATRSIGKRRFSF